MINLKLSKYSILAKKHPFKFSCLVMDYLVEFKNHLNGYTNLAEIELKAKYPAPSEKERLIKQIKCLNMIHS